ncbi:MAG TPA: enoyl-CoA hydratase/isomerase family protein [Candidatus Polarisedimenticolaceae bacterium]
MPSSSVPVRAHVENGFGVVTLAGEHANAIDPDLVAGLRAAFRELARDPGAGAVVLRGEGKLFCPGLDLQDLLPLDRDAMAAFMADFGACVVEMFAFPKPVVAALHGHAVAGGLVLALTADWRLARRGVWLGLNEVKVGVPLPFGVARLLRAAISPSSLTEVALLGRNFKDDAAVAAGLAHEIVDAERFDDACLERIQEFLGKDAASLATTKRYLRESAVAEIRAQEAARLPEWLDAWFSPGTRARVEEIVAGLSGRKR